LNKYSLSVILPNYNYAHYLYERLRCILSQNYPIQEIIILDDHSTDHSLEKIFRFAQSQNFPLFIVPNSQNSGSVFAQWIRGMELATGDYIWIAEADDLSDPGFLEEVMAPIHDDPSVVLSYCLSRIIDSEGNVVEADYRYATDDLDPERWKYPFICDGIDEIKKSFAVKNIIPNVSSCIFRRPKNPGKFLEQLLEYRIAGDWYFYIELLKEGKIAYSPKVLNSYRRHSSSVVASRNNNFQHYKELISLQEKVAREFDISATTLDQARTYRESARWWLCIHNEKISSYFFNFGNSSNPPTDTIGVLQDEIGELYQRFERYRALRDKNQKDHQYPDFQLFDLGVVLARDYIVSYTPNLSSEGTLLVQVQKQLPYSENDLEDFRWFLSRFFPGARGELFS